MLSLDHHGVWTYDFSAQNKTPTKRLLDIWPPFPIILSVPPPFPVVDKSGVENIIAALECRDRITKIDIYEIRGAVLNELVTVLHKPLPVLAHFSLSSYYSSVPALPETFLGGSAPRLRSFVLKGIPFPSFPRFIYVSLTSFTFTLMKSRIPVTFHPRL
jgi:hypothetical protein